MRLLRDNVYIDTVVQQFTHLAGNRLPCVKGEKGWLCIIFARFKAVSIECDVKGPMGVPPDDFAGHPMTTSCCMTFRFFIIHPPGNAGSRESLSDCKERAWRSS